MGNVTLGHGAGTLSSVIAGVGANIGNAVAHFSQIQTQGATANVTTAIAYGMQFQTVSPAPTVPPTTVIGYYMPNNTATYGMSSAAGFRGATNYFFLKNDDDVAQSQVGSLRAFHEFNYGSNSTSGSITINKANGQTQQITPTGALTITGFSNFVTSASDGTNTDEQADTVTLIISQPAGSGYAVNLPTGSTFKYAGGANTVGTTAESVTMISITGIRIGGTTTYLITVSPEFS
jgi:hypothetical protein